MRKFVYSVQPAHTFQQPVAGIYFDVVDEGEAQRKFAAWLYNDLGVWAFAHSVVKYEEECEAKKEGITWVGPGYYDINANHPFLLKSEADAGFSSMVVNGTNYFYSCH